MTTTNGATLNSKLMERLTANVLSFRQDYIRQFTDPRRNINDECGYPLNPTSQDYQTLYEREAIAARVVEVLSKESWQVQPCIYEDEDPNTITDFEEAWDGISKQIRGEQSHYQDEKGSAIWEYLQRVDEQSGIGQYGILLIGIDDGLPLDQPAYMQGAPQESVSVPAGTDAQYFAEFTTPYSPATASKPGDRKLLFLRVFPEALVQITQFEYDPTSPHFGQPNMYLVTFNDPRQQQGGIGIPLASKNVHWTRVIHVADNLASSEVFGVPRMQPVLNRLLDLQKVYASDGEAYWKNCLIKLLLETHPQLGGDVDVNTSEIRDNVEQFMNSLQPYLGLAGMSGKTVAPSVVDPTAHIAVQIEAICIKLGIPVRVFKGSERGELASSQDDAAWNDRLKQRQNGYLTPRVIVPLIDRLIAMGVLPEPEGYTVWWPDLTSQTDGDRADVAVKRTAALAQYAQGGVDSIIPPMDYLTRILGFEEEEAATILQNAAGALEDPAADTGGSPLLGLVGGITGALEIFQKFREGSLSEEQVKQLLMLFYKIDEAKADEIMADGLPPAPAVPPVGGNPFGGKPGVLPDKRLPTDDVYGADANAAK